MKQSLFKISLEQKGMPPNVKKHMNTILEMVADAARHNWINLARQGLKTTAKTYIDGIGDVKLGRGQATIKLSGKLPNLIENGSPPFDMKCLVSPNTKIYTSKGYIKIKDIRVGDLVLTHLGRFQKVLNISNEVNKDEFIYKISTTYSSIPITANHPILTEVGWKRVSELEKTDKVCVLSTSCRICGKLVEVENRGKNENKLFDRCCSHSCGCKSAHLSEKWHSRVIQGKWTVEDRKKVSISTTRRNKEWAQNGIHPFQNPEVIKKSRMACGSAYKFSWPERMLWEKLKGKDNWERQFPVKRDLLTSKGCHRIFFLDFANPKLKIAVEVNGERFHTEEGIYKRTKELEEKDWRVLNFWSQYVVHNTIDCISEIERLEKNHNNGFEFSFVPFKMQKIRRKKYSNYRKYNLTIEDDSSFVAGTIVVHNSGFLRSPKVKRDRKGRPYLTIPFGLKTPGGGDRGTSPPVMPRPLYRLASRLQFGESIGRLPRKYEGYAIRTRLSPDLKQWGHYTWKASPFAGVAKVRRYPGELPTAPTGRMGIYMTFRRVSKKSDPNSWVHPGFKQKNFMEQAVGKLDNMLPEIIEKVLNENI